MVFELPELDYEYGALEPHIDAKTMEIHYSKHHAGYVSKLNAALEGQEELAGKSIEELLGGIEEVPEGIRQAVINNGGGHANHSLFWKVMSAKGGGVPKGELAQAIEKEFGGFEKFRERFSEKAKTLFGSGWVFLVVANGKLMCKRHSFQNSPLMNGNVPILGLDVWEHAYYLKYQNLRPDYIEAWWNVVNWEEVERRYKEAL